MSGAERLQAAGLSVQLPPDEDLFAQAPSGGQVEHEAPLTPQGTTASNWPTLGAGAFHGPIGDYVREAAPHTEADPAAVLVQLLAGVGVIANSAPHVLAGNSRHPGALFVAVVGATGSGAKGTSWSAARLLLDAIDSDFTRHRILGGFGSGEVMIETLAAKPDDEDASRDTRLLIHEGELGAIFRVAGRKDATLGQRLRNAWDGVKLEARTRGRGTVEVHEGAYHLGLVSHITAEEIRATLTDSDTFGGTVNRFLWCPSRRTQLLPEGGNIPIAVAHQAAAALTPNIKAARLRGRLDRTGAAKDLWAEQYRLIAEDEPGGVLGAAISRAAPQVLRLALVYAIADGADAVDAVHHEAAWAVWQYARAGAEMIFPRVRSMADRIAQAVAEAGPRGLTRTEVHSLLSGHAAKAAIDQAVAELLKVGTVVEDTESTGGRPRKVLKVAS